MSKKGSAINKPQRISPELASVIGKGPMSRGTVMKKIWAYIKKKKLQNPKNRRNIILDATLKELFNTKKREISMFELAKLLTPHIGDEVSGKSPSKKAGRKVKRNPYDDDDDFDVYDNPSDDDDDIDYEDEDEDDDDYDDYDDDDDDDDYED
jgi:chromatin remodeling complex protein RSC6